MDLTARVEERSLSPGPSNIGGADPLSMSDAFVINLDRTPERMQWFRQTNPHLEDVTRFSAVDGATIDREVLLREGVFVGPIAYTDGAIGAALSHLRLWDTAASRKSYITVFEDDAIIHQDFMTLAPAILAECFSDWDIVLWGWNFDAALSFDIFPEVPCFSRFSQSNLRANWAKIQNYAMRRPPLYRLHCGFGTVGYSISPAGARKLAGLVFPIRPFRYRHPVANLEIENVGIDCALTAIYDSVNAYACIPPLVITKNEHELSTIQKRGLLDRRFERVRRILRRFAGAPKRFVVG